MLNQTKTINIPLDLHSKLKIEAVKKDMKLRDLVVKILQNKIKEIEDGKQS